MSKGLEALEELKKYIYPKSKMYKKLSIIEEELKRLEKLEKAFVALSKEDEEAKEILSLVIEKNMVLEIIFEAPYIVDLLFRKGELGKKASERYMWGTISVEDVKRVKEFFADGKRDQSK